MSVRNSSRCFGTDITNDPHASRQGKKHENIQTREMSKFDDALKNDEKYSSRYINEVISFLFENEKAIKDYISSKSVSVHARVQILNWIACVHSKFELFDSTLYLAVNIIDRYLGTINGMISNNDLKLLGCTALWISSKYHEIYAPVPDDFCAVSGNSIQTQQLTQMEIIILRAIDFDITVATPLSFIERFYQIGFYYIRSTGASSQMIDKKSKILKSLMMYCSEICMNDYKLSLELPSKIACSILYYCCIGTGIFSWKQFQDDNVLQYVNNYTMNDTRFIMEAIHKKAIKVNKDSRIYTKYSSAEYHRVSQIPSKFQTVK